jgi:hypothetical protein
MPTSFGDIRLAFDFVDSNSPGANNAILCRRTGKIYWRSRSSGLDELSDGINDELPNDIADEDNYIAIPDKRDLGLGKPLVLDFVSEFLPGDFDEVRYMFSKRGAYPKFKALLARRNAIDRWHDFQSKATDKALRDWCEADSIEVSD